MKTAKFGGKEFVVTSSKILTPDDLSLSESLDIEETEVSGKKPSVKVKGIKLQTLSFKVQLDRRFVDVTAELRYWKNILLAKSSKMLVYGSYKVGQFFLTQYDVSDISLLKNGDYSRATLTLTFTEHGDYYNKHGKVNFDGSSASASSTASTNTKAAAVKKSASTTTKKKSTTIKKGTKVKPKSGTRWYYTAEGALKKTGKSGKAYNKAMTVSYIYQNGKAINPQGLGWMRPEDVDIV